MYWEQTIPQDYRINSSTKSCYRTAFCTFFSVIGNGNLLLIYIIHITRCEVWNTLYLTRRILRPVIYSTIYSNALELYTHLSEEKIKL